MHVHSLTVSPQHRRRGIAYRLLKLIKKKAIDDCVSEQICVNNEIDADDFDVSLLMSLLTIDDCIFEEICVTNEIDADDFGVSLLAIDDVIFEYHERNVQRKKCARKSKSRRSRPKLRERVASRCRGRQVPGVGPGMLSEVEMAARGRLRCLGPGEILRGRVRSS